MCTQGNDIYVYKHCTLYVRKDVHVTIESYSKLDFGIYLSAIWGRNSLEN